MRTIQVLILVLGTVGCAAGTARAGRGNWLGLVRREHPRMFFNKETAATVTPVVRYS